MRPEAVRLGQRRRSHAGMVLAEEDLAMGIAILCRDMVAAAEDLEIEAVDIVFVRVLTQYVVVHACDRWLVVLQRRDFAHMDVAIIGDGDEGIADIHGFNLVFVGVSVWKHLGRNA